MYIPKKILWVVNDWLNMRDRQEKTVLKHWHTKCFFDIEEISMSNYLNKIQFLQYLWIINWRYQVLLLNYERYSQGRKLEIIFFVFSIVLSTCKMAGSMTTALKLKQWAKKCFLIGKRRNSGLVEGKLGDWSKSFGMAKGGWIFNGSGTLARFGHLLPSVFTVVLSFL